MTGRKSKKIFIGLEWRRPGRTAPRSLSRHRDAAGIDPDEAVPAAGCAARAGPHHLPAHGPLG
jgi:hypothetical protein